MAKQVGRGARVYWGDTGAATNFVELIQCESIGEISGESQEIEVTDLSSTAREYLAALADSPEIAYALQWDPLNAGHQQMDTDQRAGTRRYFKVEVVRDGSLIRTGTYLAFVKRFGVGPFENQTVVKLNMTHRLSGTITWT